MPASWTKAVVQAPEPPVEGSGLPALWRRWATLPYPILIRGERGTGKTALASELHRASGRSGLLVNASMAAIPKGLELAELFGHCRGAFTTALADRDGVITQAHRGTVFLDELGRASLEAQSALLGFLDHGRLKPIGSTRELILDVRVIAASNADLAQMVEAGTFLPDLIDRMGYHVIEMKPLRDRRGDILPLTHRILKRESARLGRDRPPVLSPALQRVLLKAPWPGNLRDLVKLCEYLAGSAGDEVAMGDLPEMFCTGGEGRSRADESLAAAARRTVDACGGNKTEAARRLGKSRGHLHRLLKQGVDH